MLALLVYHCYCCPTVSKQNTRYKVVLKGPCPDITKAVPFGEALKTALYTCDYNWTTFTSWPTGKKYDDGLEPFWLVRIGGVLLPERINHWYTLSFHTYYREGTTYYTIHPYDNNEYPKVFFNKLAHIKCGVNITFEPRIVVTSSYVQLITFSK